MAEGDALDLREGTLGVICLDLFCGAGGASMGYAERGYTPIGIDINPQPHYPFEFHRMDWRDGLRQFGSLADLIHASPPCQGYSAMRTVTGRTYPLLIEAVRDALIATRALWVIENVERALPYMVEPITLCGQMFGLDVVRHRLFESNIPVVEPVHPGHRAGTYAPTGHGDPNRRERERFPHLRGRGYAQRCRDAMRIQWMNRDELAQAIPPAYTRYMATMIREFVAV